MGIRPIEWHVGGKVSTKGSNELLNILQVVLRGATPATAAKRAWQKKIGSSTPTRTSAIASGCARQQPAIYDFWSGGSCPI